MNSTEINDCIEMYVYYVWEILRELRACDGLDAEEVKKVLEMLKCIDEIYKGSNEIEKTVAETFDSLPEDIIYIGEIDMIEGQEIKAFGNKLLEFRARTVESKSTSNQQDDLIDKFREYSIGENGFLTLAEKGNKVDIEKLRKTLACLSEFIKRYKDNDKLDKEIVRIIVEINRYLFEEDLQLNRDIADNFCADYVHLKNDLFE